jgi:sigma54-dependent transcription regulator
VSNSPLDILNEVVLTGIISIKQTGLDEYPVLGGKRWVGAKIVQRTTAVKNDGTQVNPLVCSLDLDISDEAIATAVAQADGKKVKVLASLVTQDTNASKRAKAIESGVEHKANWVTKLVIKKVEVTK